MKEPGEPPLDLPPCVVVDDAHARVTVVPVGWIAVRPPHREHGGPWALRYPALLASTIWAPWMPVNVVLVEHESGTVLVDTGEAVDQPPGYFGCGDAGQERFYRTFLRIPVRPGTAAPDRVRALGVDPAQVDTVVLSHLHSDHVGGLASFPRARVVIGPGARRATGALPCRLPADRVREDSAPDEPVGPFARSGSLTSDGRVRTVPLPGHTPGHLGVLIAAGERLVVAAGDAAFDHDQIRRRALSAVVHDPDANRATQAQLAAVLDDGGTVLLAHQPLAELGV